MARSQAQRVFKSGELTKPFCRPNTYFPLSNPDEAQRFIRNFNLLVEHYGLAGVRGSPKFWKWLAIALIFDFVPGLSSRASKLGRPKATIQFERRRAAQMLVPIAAELRQRDPSVSEIKRAQLVAKEFKRRYPNNPLARKHWRTIERTLRPDFSELSLKRSIALELAAAIEFIGDKKIPVDGDRLKALRFRSELGWHAWNWTFVDYEAALAKISEAAEGRMICEAFADRDQRHSRRRSKRNMPK
jgi:hypothetical protein